MIRISPEMTIRLKRSGYTTAQKNNVNWCHVLGEAGQRHSKFNPLRREVNAF